ncbi:MAG: DUF1232 domain-containing protein [Methanobacteriota archaeon]|nr:MAG: DUF1232 domain-containing protein [Euryarchaeota archaeon]
MDAESTPSPLFKGFYEMLVESVRDYKGDFKEVVKLTPEIFKLFTNLLEDPLVPASGKPIINAAIAYFVAPFDALPEEVYGPVGYLDDLFLATWALKKLEEIVGYAVLENNWEGEEELSTVIDEVHRRTKAVISEVEEDILDYVGLR